MTKNRNEFLELDGLYWESETHEWFHDKTSTNYAQTDNGLNTDALHNIHCFVVRNKETGEYDRVMMDSKTNSIIYNTKSLEDLSYRIDQMKIMKRYDS
jgi:hypothetical protein